MEDDVPFQKRVTFSVPADNFQGGILKGTESTPIER